MRLLKGFYIQLEALGHLLFLQAMLVREKQQ